MEPRRILVLAARVSGGVGTIGRTLVEGLNERGYRADFAATSEVAGASFETMKSLGVPVLAPNAGEMRRRVRCERLLDLARSYDVILANDNWETHAILPELGPRIPTLLIFNGTDKRIFRMAAWNAEYAAGLVSTCRASIPPMVAAGLPQDRISLVFNGVREQVPPPRERPGLKILFCGRMEQIDKNVQVLPRICAGLSAYGSAYELHLAGQGPDEAWLKNQLSPFSPHIQWHGQLRPQEVFALMRECDFLLMPSLHEALPLALLEAMAVGCVPVLSNIAPFTEVAREHASQLCHAPSDAKGMAATLMRLASGPVAYHAVSSAMLKLQRECYSRSSMVGGYETRVKAARAPPLPSRGFLKAAPLRQRVKMSGMYEMLAEWKRAFRKRTK